MNFNWKKDIYSDRYSSDSDHRPGSSKAYVEYVLPWGFKILGIAIAFFPIVYKIDALYIHSRLFGQLSFSDSLLLFIVMVGLAIETKSESKKYLKETQSRRINMLIILVIAAFVYFYKYIPQIFNEIW